MLTTRIALGLAGLGVATVVLNLAALSPRVAAIVAVAVLLGVAGFLLRRSDYRRRAPKSAAFEIYIEFGPEGLMPRPERLAKAFPSLTSEEILQWIDNFREIETEMWRLAELGGSSALSDSDMTMQLGSKFPFLESRAITAAICQVNHYAWHDGYILEPKEKKGPII